MPETFSRVINIYVESGQAKQAYDVLAKKQTDQNERLESLKKKQQEYFDRIKSGSAAAQKLYDNVTDKIVKEEAALKKTTDALDKQAKIINGTLSPSFRQLQATVTSLERELKSMNEQDDGFELKKQQYNEARGALDKYKLSLTTVKQGLKDMLKEAKGIAVGVLIGNTVQAIAQSVGAAFGGFVSGAAKVSDEITDIEKTTELTTEQIRALNREFTKLDTRTTNSKLRGYAEEAGKLGKESLQDVKRFVDEANQIDTALGEDLGEGAITNIGKVADIYETSMLKIGSAINEVGASSSANERFQQEFIFRLAGTSKQLNITAADVLGFGAALDINGAQVEASSTALQNFLLDFAKNTEKYGKAAGMAKGELTALANERGINVAFQTFLKGLRDTSKSTDDFLLKMEKLGIDGTRGASTFLTLANNLELVQQQQAIANQAFNEGTSITAEYEKRNNNLAATIDKISKEWNSITASSSVQDFLVSGASLTLNFVKALSQLPRYIRENSTLLISLATAYALYNIQSIAATLNTYKNTAARIANNAAWFAGYTIIRAATVVQTAYSLATGVLTGQITLATAATRVWAATTAMATGGLTLVAAAIIAAGVALNSWVKSRRDLTSLDEVSNRLNATTAERFAEEKIRLEQLLDVARNENALKKDRIAAIKKLNELSPEYLGNLTLENINTTAATAAIHKYIEAQEKQIKLEAIRERLVELAKERIKEQSLSLEDAVTWTDRLLSAMNGHVSAEIYAAQRQSKKIALNAKEAESLKQLDLQIRGMEYGPQTQGNSKSFSMTDYSPVKKQNDLNLSGGSTELSADEKARETALKRLEDFHQKIANLKRESAAAIISEDEKERAAVETKLREHLAELENLKRDAHLKDIVDLNRWQQEEQLIKQDYSQRLAELDKKQFDRRSQNEYEATVHATEQVYVRRRADLEKQYEQGLIAERLYLQAIGSLNEQESTAKIQVALDYSKTVEKAQTDLTKFEDEQYKIRTRNARQAAQQQADDRQQLLNTQTQTIGAARSNNPNSVALIEREYDLKRTALAQQFEDELRLNEGKEKAVTAIYAKYSELRKNLEREEADAKRESITGQIQLYFNLASQVADIFQGIGQIQSNIENAQLAKEKRTNSQRIAQYDKMLSEKRITQQKHDTLVEQANRQSAKKEDEIKRKQFERNKLFQISNTIIQTATASMQAYSSLVGLPVVGPALAAVAAAATAAFGAVQIGIIASEQYQPTSYGDGTPALGGDKHSDRSGGNPIIDPKTGKIIGYAERGEAIIPSDSVENNPEIIDALLTTGRGHKLIDTVRPVKSMNIEQNLKNIQYANGGYIGVPRSPQPRSSSSPATVTQPDPQMSEQNALLRQQNGLLQLIADKEWSWSLKEMYKTTDEYKNILNRGI